jgi:hypothetical protein
MIFLFFRVEQLLIYNLDVPHKCRVSINESKLPGWCTPSITDWFFSIKLITQQIVRYLGKARISLMSQRLHIVVEIVVWSGLSQFIFASYLQGYYFVFDDDESIPM